MPARRCFPRRAQGRNRGKLAAALVYQQTHAPFAVQIINDHRKRGEPIPAPFDNPPAVSQFHQIYIDAFFELCLERQPSNDPKMVHRITREQIRGWLAWYGLDDRSDFRDEFLTVMFTMDNAFIPIERKRLEKEARNQERKGKRRGAKSK